MIQERGIKGKRPIIKHTENKQITADVKKILKAFFKEMEQKVGAMILSGEVKEKYLLKEEKVKGETLLELRRKLAYLIKKGMCERKDLELEIAIYAGLVWLGRIEKGRADKILAEWG